MSVTGVTSSTGTVLTRASEPSGATADKETAWIISDKSAERQQILQALGFRTIHFHHDLHSKGHLSYMLRRMQIQRPRLLWIRLAGPCAGSGNKQDASRTVHLCELASSQCALGGAVIVEANVRSQGWNMQVIKNLLEGMSVSQHSWCRYESCLEPHELRCNSVVQLATNFPFSSRVCGCDAAVSHVDSKRLRIGKDNRWSAVLSKLVSEAVNAVCSQDRMHRQPELISTSSALLSRGERPPTPREMMNEHHVASARAPDASSASCVRDSKAVSFCDEAVSYPTEQAIRRKAVLATGHVPKRKHQNVEQHRDDCGDSLDSILEYVEVLPWSPELMGGESSNVEHTGYQFYEGCAEFSLGKGRWLHGSASRHPMHRISSRPAVSLAQLNDFHEKCQRKFELGCLAVVELFGGVGHTTYMVAKIYGLKAGINFDITSGFDLNKIEDVKMLLHYVETRQPLVIIMAPPCKGFGALQNLNKIINPDAWKQAKREGIPLARLCAQLARFQMQSGRHFILEQPAGSTMFELDEWKRLATDFELFRCQFDQCCVGLRMNRHPFLHVRKPTVLVASQASLIHRFADKQCRGDHEHASISRFGTQ